MPCHAIQHSPDLRDDTTALPRGKEVNMIDRKPGRKTTSLSVDRSTYSTIGVFASMAFTTLPSLVHSTRVREFKLESTPHAL